MIKIEDIEFAIDMVTHSNVIPIEVFLNTKTKVLIYPDEDGEFDSGVDLEDEDLLPIPSRTELGLGKPLALQFAQECRSRHILEQWRILQIQRIVVGAGSNRSMV